MMPAQGRPAAPPSLLSLSDEATIPFSDLFNNGFDRATIDATAQLADRSIFVASNGRRYRIESLPDSDSDPSHAPIPVPISGRARAPALPPASSAPARHAYLQAPPASGPLGLGRAAPPPVPQLHVPDSGPGWRRSSSNASSHSYSPGGYSVRSGQAAGAVPGAEPNVSAHELSATMTYVSSSSNHFGAASLYGLSDGGAQAAENLTDRPDLGPRSPILNRSTPTVATSPRISYIQQHPPRPQASQRAPTYDHTSLGASPGLWTNVDYASYTAQTIAHREHARQQALTATGFPSLLEGATVITPPHRASDPVSSFSLIPDDKEVCDGQASGNGYYYPPLHASISAPSSLVSRNPSRVTTVGAAADFDTQTPVVVHPPQAPSTFSDGASTGRDNVLPGEDLLFDGPVKSAQTLMSPVFRDGILKVFRNNLTNDLRFHCRVERESETYWLKANNAQLVPAYAYDQRLPHVVYIRDKESDKGSGYMGASQGNARPSGIYQFSTLKELFDFQAKLTGEKVVLDIGSVRMVTLSKANSRSSIQFSSARLQIWHEVEGRRNHPSDVASFVTAGTALSGPHRDRMVPSSSRLILYLGRSGEYITLFITDDIEIKAEGQTLVKLKPRKGTLPFSRKASRWPWVKAHLETNQGSESAGFDIHGKAVEVDVGSAYDSYKTFEIDFETSPSQDNFVRKWDEVMRERRLQRMKLQRIQEEMESAVFTGRQARGVFT